MRRVACSLLLLGGALAGCGRTTTTTASSTPPPVPEPAPPAIVSEAPAAQTIDEARSLRRGGDLAQYERSLRVLASSDDPKIARRALALLGLHLFDRKQDADAIRALEDAAHRYPEVAPFLRLRVVELHERSGDPAAAARVASELAAGNSSAATIAKLRLPALHAQAEDRAATDSAFAQLAGVTIDELTEGDFTDVAARLAKAGRADLATSIRMRLLNDYTNGRFTERTYAQIVATPSTPLDALSLDEATALASKLARANRYDQALELLGRIAQRFPQSDANTAYRDLRMRALFNSRNYTQLLAETEGTKLTDPALVLLRARAAWRDDRPADMLTGLRQLEREFPNSKEALEAKVIRAKYHTTDAPNLDLAIENLSAAVNAGAMGSDGENLWNLGFTHMLAGKDDDALRTFDKYIAAYPDGDWKTNSLFWSAKILQRLGRTEEGAAKYRQVIAEYPYSYYAYRSRTILGMPTVAPSDIDNGNVFPDVTAALASVNDPRLAAVRELLSIDLLRDATREMKLLAAAYPDNLGVAYMLADVYVEGGEPFRANGVLQRRFRPFIRHGGMGVPPRFWQILYPLAYWEPIREEAARRNLDPYLVASIIRQESGFEPTTVSNAGAVGLMQIMPQEAARIASLAGIEGITREALFDPNRNIAVGAAEYAQKLERQNGNHVLAIASYNAGETAVDQWAARVPPSDLDLFVETIPYAETRLYVKSVTRNQFEYRRIYGSGN